MLRRLAGVVLRGARRTRKQAARRFKGVGEVSRRARRAQKDLYFWARQNSGGQLLLETAGWMQAPLDRLRRRRVAAAYVASRPAGPGLDPSGGFQVLALQNVPEFAPVLATCRRLRCYAVDRNDVELRVLHTDFVGSHEVR